jgi:hypothetical protein
MNVKWKMTLLLLASLYCLYYFQSAAKGTWHFIDNVDLIIHEAGHFVFAPFSEFVTAAGGSLLQVIVPLVFFGYFYWKKQMFSAGAMLLWAAINFFNVAIYADDALKMKLPLLGGENSIHDWNFMLADKGWVRQAPIIASVINFFGFCCMAIAVLLGWLAMWDKTPDAKYQSISR